MPIEKPVPPALYVQDPTKEYPRTRLEEGEYARAIQRFPVVCTDIGIVDMASRQLFLAQRQTRPGRGWDWFIGGGSFVGESAPSSAQRCFERETGLLIPEDRFKFVCMNRYLFNDRQQEPQSLGCDSLCYTYSLQLGKKELDRVKLDPDEYCNWGLAGYTLENIESWDPDMNKDIILDFWGRVFG